MKSIREIFRLRTQKQFSIRKIARTLKISRPVVSEYLAKFKNSGLAFTAIANMSDDELLLHLKNTKKEESARYTNLANQFSYITKELTKTGVTLFQLWTEYKQEYSDGYSYSQFCYHYQVFKESTKTSMHMTYKAGERIFVDFTGQKWTIFDKNGGESREADIFVALLACSQYTYVEAVEDQSKESLVRCTENALWYFEGVPESIMPDCLKSGVTKYHKYEPDINPLYADFAAYYDTVIYPARPGRPQDKALVEGAVKIIYTRIYSELRRIKFYSLQELNKAILAKLDEHNNKPFQYLKFSRKQLFEEQEKSTLKPLPFDLYPMKTFAQYTVGFNYHIFLTEDKHYYSVPYQLVKKKVEVRYTEKTVEIYSNNLRVAAHKRDRTAKGYTTNELHMPEAHRKQKEFNEWTPERFINWAESIGGPVKDVIQSVLEQRKYPQQAFKSCLGILHLEKKYSKTRLITACEKALYLNSACWKTINNLLKNNLENQSNDPDLFSPLPEHGNLRGNLYYN
jgi:transposase